MGYGKEIKQQFDVGRTKGEADRAKIANALKRFTYQFWQVDFYTMFSNALKRFTYQFWQVDFYTMFFIMFLLSWSVFVAGGAYVIARLINMDYYIINPSWDYTDTNITNEQIKTLLYYYYGMELFISLVLTIVSVLCIAFAIIKEYKRYKLRRLQS